MVLVETLAVVERGVPVRLGDARLALRLSAVVTKAVVAMVVSLSPGDAVGAVGLPVKTGEP